MLDKNDRKYIIRRIITYIAIAMIMFLISSCQAKALTQSQVIGSYGDSVNITNSNYENTTLITDGINARSAFVNYGEGNLIFNVVATNGGQAVDQIQSIIVENDRDQFICNIGSFVTYTDSTTQRALYTVDCPVNFTNGYGFKKLRIKRSDVYGILVATYSPIATFVSKDSPNDYQALINALDNQTNILASTINSNNTSQAINDVNNTLNDSNPPSSSEISGNTSDWNNYNASNGVINDLVLMPVTLLNSFVNGINGSCSPYDFGELWGEHIIFPCINLSQILGSLWTIIDVILSGIFIFVFGKRCVKIFNDFTNLRSGQIDTLYGGDN